MISFNPRKIRRSHICERHEIPVEKGKAIVVILDRETVAHVGCNHIDKAKIAVIRAGTYSIKNCTLELHAEVLVVILVKRNELLLPICVLHKKLNLLICHCKAEVNDVAQGSIVDRKDLIPRYEFQLLGNAALKNAQNNPWISFRHTPPFLHEKGVTFHHSSAIV